MPFSYSNAASVPSAVTPIDRTTFITTGGTAQVLMASNPSRGGWWFLNTSSSVLYVSEIGTASSASIPINSGQEYIPPAITTGAISVFGLIDNQTFQCREWNGVPAANVTLNGGLTSSGQLTLANSLSVVPPSNYSEGVETQYVANIAGTGYAIGERLVQVVRNNGGIYNETWFNTDQKTIITAPTQAQVSANLGFSNLSSRPEWKPRKKWIIGNNGNVNPGTPFTWLAIRNTNTFPVRVISVDINLISTTQPAISTSSWNCNTNVIMYTGVTTITGGTALSVFNVPSYTNDGTIIGNSGATALTGTTTNIICGYVQPIVSYIEGATAGISARYGVSYGHKWAEGLIIPAGAMLVVQNNNGFSGPVASTFCTCSAVIVDEL